MNLDFKTKFDTEFSPHNGSTIGIISQVDDFSIFGDDKKCFNLLKIFCESFDLHVVNFSSFVFPKNENQIYPGISMVLLLAESHISIHTWPETKTFRMVIDSCKDIDHNEVIFYLLNVFCKGNSNHFHFWVERWKES